MTQTRNMSHTQLVQEFCALRENLAHVLRDVDYRLKVLEEGAEMGEEVLE